MERPLALVWETFIVFLKLGLSCFGGPIAHLGYFRDEFVERRKWLDDRAYADIVALCQFLPGPASSQVGMVIGMHRAGWIGALVAWLAFTAPSAVVMTAFAFGVGHLGDLTHAGWLAGLKLAAVAVIAQAVWTMASRFCVQISTMAIAIAAAVVVLTWSSGLAQVLVIASGTALGWLFCRGEEPASARESDTGKLHVPVSRSQGAVLLVAFATLLILLPALAAWTRDPVVQSFDHFYRSGALVFGGGHVVLPLLHAGVVDPGWVSNDRFLAGYGAVQAVPGPLFSFAAYLGAIMKPAPNGWAGALWCLLAIYLPAALITFGSLPFWETLRRQSFARALLKGANAAVVGILLAALYQPVCTSAIHRIGDGLLALADLGLLFWRVPPWLVVGCSAAAGCFLLK